ncbi:MAG: hypothetical protein K8S16_00930, partial [Bacteroidales bacterium]|nr:hypothetical protein [Bacteroidales bacterium]
MRLIITRLLIILSFSVIPHSNHKFAFDEMVFDSVFLPEVFDLRNSTYLCPVRSQPGGGCWASASNTTVESYWRKSGIEIKPLSDVNLQLFHGFEENRNTY